MGLLGATGVGVTASSAHAKALEQSSNIKQNLDSTIYVEMRDGTELATDIYLPPDEEGAFPTLIGRTPYNKDTDADLLEAANFFPSRGYAVVLQDVRGKFDSEGEFYPYRSEGNAEDKDGYDTVEWAAKQSWSNGRVGTFGRSYVGGAQWAIAHNEQLPPHLEAMAPGFVPASYYGQGAYSGGAALLSHNMDYYTGFAIEEYNQEHPGMDQEEFTFLEAAQEAMYQLYWDLPVVPFEPLQRVGDDSGSISDHAEDIVGTQRPDIPWLRDMHTHETYGDYWKVQDHTRHYDKVDIPVLNYGGWYDIFSQGTVWNYIGVNEEGSPKAQQQTELVMGPYTHGDIERRAQGAVGGHAYLFPENVTYDRNMLWLDWFNRHLKQENCTSEEIPPVRLYVPGGLNEWIGASDFPLPQTRFTKFYLHSEGNANIKDITDDHYRYEGVLSTEPPDDEQPDKYTYDPSDPVITVGGYNTHWEGGVQNRVVAYHNRDDILVYETEPLDEDVAIVGPITATLYASTSTKDTDFVVTLSDVDGAVGLFTAEGARRGRIGDVSADPREQETYAEVNLLEDGEVNEWKIAIWPTARVFEAGHRIRIDITSSNFPRYNRNQNTGEGLTSAGMIEADQTIYHDADHPSHVEMPIVPMDKVEEMIIDGPIPGKENEASSSE
jgi:putative CocE/NonD family hydrolase